MVVPEVAGRRGVVADGPARACGLRASAARDTESVEQLFLKCLNAVRWRTADTRRMAWWYLRHWIRSRWLRAASKPPKRRGSVRSRPAAVRRIESDESKLPEAPRQSVVPAFDPRLCNPFRWPRAAGNEVAAPGPIEWLPPGVEAHRVVHRDDLLRLRRFHHVEDVQAFHASDVARAGGLARMAAAGVVVHLADGGPRLRALLGAELHDLMTAGVNGLDDGARELLSIRMRRAALRDHSLQARAWQLGREAPPLVSILLATGRPRFLPRALAAVARQTWPRLELVLGLHGGPFAEVERRVAELRHPVKVVRAPASQPLGAVLAAAAAAASGTLLTKMDDDDLYGADHIWDLVLAREYSRAALVGKGVEFVYLAASDRTVHWHCGGGESYREPTTLAGGALLIARDALERAGGWRRVSGGVDQALIEDVVRAGGSVYRTHGAGFMLVRHGQRHAWDVSDGWFLARADSVVPGWNPALADLGDLDLPRPAHGRPCAHARRSSGRSS